ncbi:ankyrin repeat-containing domain protein [Baffinella frigidus]|nr:ankyrin repeat-containing domain protein [Cryptophyta sp. CCMP2293]
MTRLGTDGPASEQTGPPQDGWARLGTDGRGDGGANLESVDEDGRTALFLTAMAGSEALVNALISHKANIEASDNLKMTAVMAAAASGQDVTLEALIKAKANLEATHKKGGTALIKAKANLEATHKKGGTVFFNPQATNSDFFAFSLQANL